MTEILKAAGAPAETLKLIKSVVDTCRTCRCWAIPTPKAIAPTRMATEMGMALQWDILFYKDYAISHLIDEATRFIVTSILPGRSSVDIIRAIDKDWVRIFGPPRLIVVDGETGFDTEEIRQWLDCLVPRRRAPGHFSVLVVKPFYYQTVSY